MSPLYILIGLVSFFVYWFLIRDKNASDDDDEDSLMTSKKDYKDDGRPKMLILYGSQTGTAEEFSQTLAEEANAHGFNSIAVDMIDYTPDDLVNEPFVVFILATYGEGEPTDNARDFYEWIKDDVNLEKGESLSGLKFAVFGLGNKQYKIYQAISRYFDKRCEELGAKRVFVAGEGDADDNIEEHFDDWKANALVKFCEEFGTNADASEQAIEPKYNLRYHDEKDAANEAFITARHLEPDSKTPYLSSVASCKQLLSLSNKSVSRSTVHIEFDIKGSKVKYEAGDHLAILAENKSDLVEDYMRTLDVWENKDKIISLMHKDGKKGNHFPKKTSLKNVFTYFLDLNSIPRKKMLKALSIYATDPSDSEFLKLLSANTAEGKNEYHKFVHSECRNTLEVLKHLKSVHVPLDHFLELMPRLQPRYYSIASSSQIHKDTVHVVVAVVRYSVARNGGTDNVHRYGTASSFLESVESGRKVFMYVRKSHFHLPKDHQTPVIMIGPGTGIAPFIGFIQQRRAALMQKKKLGEAHLYFGCRTQSEDFIYSNEMKEAEKDGVISQLHVAFSREQNEKVYVQHLLEKNGESIWDLLNRNGHVFICGDAKYMAKDVEQTLARIVHKYGGKNMEEAMDFIEKMQANGRYEKDVWAP